MSKKDKLVTKEGTRNSKSAGSSELELKGNQKNSTAVPKLRFPEFRRKWEIEQLGNMYSFKTTNSFSRENLNYEAGEVKNIHYGDIHTKLATLFDITREKVPYVNPSISIEKVNSDCYCIEGDMVFADASEDLKDIGKSIEIVNLNNEKVLSGLHTLLARQKELKLTIGFGGYLFTSQNVRVQIQNEAQGSKVLGISATRLSRINICYPKQKEEQQKIASCLSSLDELIAAHSQKLEALKVHKKGLMKQLFPAEGENVPKLRFPEFKDSGEWVERKLGEVAIFLKGKGISKSDINSNGSLSCIRYGELYTHYAEVIDEVLSSTNKSADDLIISKANDVIIPSSGETKEDIATASCVLKSGIALGGDLNIIRSDINGIYLSYHLSYSKKESIAKLAQGNSVVHLYSSQLKGLAINFPEKIEEQQKIASSLYSLDKLISTQTQKIETLKAHKKGLMQQLFPAANPLD